jgi:hypothetical protein
MRTSGPWKPYVPRAVDPARFEERDPFAGAYPAGQVGFDPAQMEAALMQQYNGLLEQREAAIRRSGGGAAAPYNAALKKIEEALIKVQQAKAQVPKVFEAFGTDIQEGYDEAVAKIAGYRGMEKVYQDQIFTHSQAQIERNYSEAQGRTTKFMETIGADPMSAAVVADMVGEMENTIMSWSEVSHENALRAGAAASRAAEAAARLAGATSAADMKRNQILIELDLKEKYKDLIEQKENTLAARSRAVSAARSATAAAWEDILGRMRFPVGDDYLAFFDDRYLRDMQQRFNFSPSDMEVMNMLIPQMYDIFYDELGGIDPSKLFHQVRWMMTDPFGLNRLAGSPGVQKDAGGNVLPNPFQELFANMSATEFDQYAAAIAEGIALRFERQQHQQTLGSPQDYAAGSMDYFEAWWQQDSAYAPLDPAQWWDYAKETTADILTETPVQYGAYEQEPTTRTSGRKAKR